MIDKFPCGVSVSGSVAELLPEVTSSTCETVAVFDKLPVAVEEIVAVTM